MKLNIMVCDWCGVRSDQISDRWELAIKPVAIKCPPDGGNGGEITSDLCYHCRSAAWDGLVETRRIREAIRNTGAPAPEATDAK